MQSTHKIKKIKNVSYSIIVVRSFVAANRLPAIFVYIIMYYNRITPRIHKCHSYIMSYYIAIYIFKNCCYACRMIQARVFKCAHSSSLVIKLLKHNTVVVENKTSCPYHVFALQKLFWYFPGINVFYFFPYPDDRCRTTQRLLFVLYIYSKTVVYRKWKKIYILYRVNKQCALLYRCCVWYTLVFVCIHVLIVFIHIYNHLSTPWTTIFFSVSFNDDYIALH